MKKECPEFVRNLSKKLTVQIPDISIVRKVIQKMSVSGRCNLSGNRPEFVRKTDLRSFSGTFSGQWKCPEFVQLICWTIITFIIQSFAIKLVS